MSDRGGEGPSLTLSTICGRRALRCGSPKGGARTLLILGPRNSDHTRGADPVAVGPSSAVHHHLVPHQGGAPTVALGRRIGWTPREVHHIANAHRLRRSGRVNPYLAFESIEDPESARAKLNRHRNPAAGPCANYLKALGQGGRDEGDEQDGHLHRRVVHRRAGFRGGSAINKGRHRRVLHRHANPNSVGAGAGRDRPEEVKTAPPAAPTPEESDRGACTARPRGRRRNTPSAREG